ncbi:MAG: FadR family transcriptional regulator, partial [Planctomycetota bacterium]|nr:FadR family transcriptional regulator [Planctomycetota bacterium]
LKKLREIEIIKPSDHVVRQLKELLISGELKPGDVLPSERELAETFNIGRSYVREAFKKLELYGIFTSIPSKGTVVNEINFQCFSDFLGNIIQFGVHDVIELSEVRRALEPNIAYKAATDATDEEIDDVDALLKMLRGELGRGVVNPIKTGQFHLKLAKASHNRFFATTMGIIIPDLAHMIGDLQVNRENRGHDSQNEHEAILEAIKGRDPEKARARMQLHMDNTDKQLVSCMKSMHWR